MPFGTGPYGLGTPADASAPPTPGAGSRFLNPASRDYQIDTVSGQQAQMPALRQRVLIALITALRSSSGLQALGVKWPSKMTEAFEAEVSASCRVALRQMIEIEGSMILDGITVERGTGGRGRVTVSFTDPLTGESHDVETTP